MKQSAPGKLSFVIDGWTSSNQLPFQGVIVQWIDESWELCVQVLDFEILEGSHTGENLASSFVNTLKEFGIFKADVVHAVTTDNASNMDTFFQHFSRLCQESVSKHSISRYF